MELIRITLAGIMALLLSMPFGVCKETCFAEVSSCEESCCGDHEVKAAPSCDCDCTEACPTLHFEPLDYLPASSEAAPDAPEACDAADEAGIHSFIFAGMMTGADRLRAPPDLFAGKSRQIIHCVFRW